MSDRPDRAIRRSRWRRTVNAAYASPLSVSAWCAAHGLSERVYNVIRHTRKCLRRFEALSDEDKAKVRKKRRKPDGGNFMA